MSSDVGDVVWHLGAVGLQGEEPKYRLEDAVKAKANIIFTVTYTREDEMYHSTPFVSMLDYLKEYESRSEVSIMTPWEARRYFADLLSGGLHCRQSMKRRGLCWNNSSVWCRKK